MKRFLAFLVSIFFAVAVAPFPASAAKAPTSCAGARYQAVVCIDPTTGFGPVANVYAEGGRYQGSFRVSKIETCGRYGWFGDVWDDREFAYVVDGEFGVWIADPTVAPREPLCQYKIAWARVSDWADFRAAMDRYGVSLLRIVT